VVAEVRQGVNDPDVAEQHFRRQVIRIRLSQNGGQMAFGDGVVWSRLKQKSNQDSAVAKAGFHGG
jgi:hypothetical protein